jgi:hypothetical protein
MVSCCERRRSEIDREVPHLEGMAGDRRRVFEDTVLGRPSYRGRKKGMIGRHHGATSSESEAKVYRARFGSISLGREMRSKRPLVVEQILR